jgi:hypothetical protein
MAYQKHNHISYLDALQCGGVYQISIEGMDYDEDRIYDLMEIANNALHAVGTQYRLTYVFVDGDFIKEQGI